MPNSPILLWFRRDLRLSDHPALTAAQASGRPVIPVFLHDECVDDLGAAPKFRLGLSVQALSDDLSRIGARLTLRRGAALASLQELIAQTGATSVWWSRLYDPTSIARDTGVKAALLEQGVEARSFDGHVLFEPWTVTTGAGGYYRVYTPFWNAVRGRPVADVIPTVSHLTNPAHWPETDTIADWNMSHAMRRGAAVVGAHVTVGERAAIDRLGNFGATRIDRYKTDRDFPALPATSGLSENLTYGEISPKTIWHAGWAAMERGAAGAEHFLKELVWRDFAYHLVYHSPELVSGNWRPEWNGFAWNTDEDRADVVAWKQGRTGVDFVDAAMREMYVTGTMHNRARMIVGSYLTKHLLTDWRIGQRWFADCLTDWDPAANAMGWQWVAGSGPDAAPYFRVFNPDGQADKFDADGRYRRRWIAEGQGNPPETALSYFDAVPRSWGLFPKMPRAKPHLTLAQGRERALAAYQELRGATVG